MDDRPGIGDRLRRKGDTCFRSIHNGARHFIHRLIDCEENSNGFSYSALCGSKYHSQGSRSSHPYPLPFAAAADAGIMVIARTVMGFAFFHHKIRVDKRDGLIHHLFQQRTGETHPQRGSPEQKIAVDDRLADLRVKHLHVTHSPGVLTQQPKQPVQYLRSISRRVKISTSCCFAAQQLFESSLIYVSKTVFCDSGFPLRIVIFIFPTFPN